MKEVKNPFHIPQATTIYKVLADRLAWEAFNNFCPFFKKKKNKK